MDNRTIVLSDATITRIIFGVHLLELDDNKEPLIADPETKKNHNNEKNNIKV